MSWKPQTHRRVLAVFLVVDVTAGLFFAAGAAHAASTLSSAVPPTAKIAPVTATASAVTIPWNDGTRSVDNPNFDALRDLEFSVSQTNDLTYQSVEITWQHGQATSNLEFAHDYMQIMQCWGNPGDTTAQPERCQWGAPSSSFAALLGSNAASRILTWGEDPAQQYSGIFQIPAPPTNPNLRAFAVPFAPASGATTYDVNTYFSTSSTNEVTGAVTSTNGTGTSLFEIQTSLESPHLGCGAPVGETTEIRDCWLVIVPRGDRAANGDDFASIDGARISGSPLSASNWENRVEIPLTFQSVASGCPIGATETRTVGNELVSEAFTSWQSALCAQDEVYGFSQVGDQEARDQISSVVDGASRFGFVSRPLAEVSETDPVVYAPIAQSALTIAYNIDYNLRGGSRLIANNGQPVTNLKLTPRLVAKMLTQSYRNDVPNGNNQSHVATNPRSLRHDPDFLALNPDFAEFQNTSEPAGLLLPLGNSDAYSQVWQWLLSDSDARAFLSGQPDPWGMKLNAYYTALNIPGDASLNSFPKADQSTYREANYIPAPGYGSFELRPYVSDLGEAARKLRRGDTGIKIFWDTTKTPAGFTASPLQAPSQHFLFALTDIASAHRLGLQTAELKNAAGAFVAPSDQSISAGIAAFAPSAVDGVSVFSGTTVNAAAYPLSVMTYSAVSYCTATLTELAAYATLLEYVQGDGQTIGTTRGNLPEGYVPLTTEQRGRIDASLSTIRNEIATPQCAQHLAQPETPVETPAPSDIAVEVPVAEQPDTSTAVDPDIASGEYIDAQNSLLRYSFLSAACFGLPLLFGGRTMKTLASRHPIASSH